MFSLTLLFLHLYFFVLQLTLFLSSGYIITLTLFYQLYPHAGFPSKTIPAAIFLYYIFFSLHLELILTLFLYFLLMYEAYGVVRFPSVSTTFQKEYDRF